MNATITTPNPGSPVSAQLTSLTDPRTSIRGTATLALAAATWVLGVALWLALLLSPHSPLAPESVWMVGALTLVCGGSFGLVPRAAIWARVIPFAGATVAVGIAIALVYVTAMIFSAGQNSDIEAGAGLVILIVPATILLTTGLGLAALIGWSIRVVVGRARGRVGASAGSRT